MAGVDLNTVRELMGHKTIRMTQRHAHMSPAHELDAVERLGRRTTGTTTGARASEGKNSGKNWPSKRRKPLITQGLHRERATGVEPATSSLGS
jgi:hypothetical protein